MAGGGKITVLWNHAQTAQVSIKGAAGQNSTNFTVNGSPVTFPVTVSANTTFVTTTNDEYSVSVLVNNVEIADKPDGVKRVDLNGGGVELIFAPSPDDGFVSPTAPPSGGGGGSTDRGTLYLKASGTSLSLASGSIAAGDGVVMGYELDTAKSAVVPDWVTQVEGTFVLHEIATYRAAIAVKATANYPGTPTLVYIDTYENALSGGHLGQASDGSGDAPGYSVDLVTDIPFFCKELTIPDIASHNYPITLAGFTVDNDGDQTADATVDIEARLSITQVGSGPTRYVSGDLS